jgi:DNA-binding transcriptional ArsR family regulator
MVAKDASEKKKQWTEKIKKEGRNKANPTEDHAIGLRTLQNPIRRKILKLLYNKPMCLDDIQNDLGLNSTTAKFHIDMLENALYVDKVENSNPQEYQLSPRAEGYLENVEGVNK